MTLLQKYHKQEFSKKSINQLKELKRKYDLKYPDNLKYTLKLILVQNSIAQKGAIESSFENFRNRHFDMWDNLTFQERNRLFQMDFLDVRSKLNSFEYQGERIYIPIFDILFNNLYDRETAILELPQYFKLNQDFKEAMIDVEQYGLKPYAAGICFPCLAKRDDSVILYDEQMNTFYRVNDQVVPYPLYDKKQIEKEDAHILASHLSDFNDAAFLNYALEQGYLHPKLAKKLEKKRR